VATSPEPIEAVSQRLDKFLSEQLSYASAVGPEAEAFTRSGASALQGGKRLRARFCLAGWSAVRALEAPPSSSFDESALAVATSLEIFHAAALVHDDLVDNSDTRRGQPAAHRALQKAHQDADWAGDSDAFGRSGAILLGDLLVAWSDDLLEEGLKGHRHAAPTRRAYARMRGADEAQLDALGRFGHDVGMAFQLRDDVLGVFGDSAVTGKPVGDDLREGKRTVLVAYARESLSPQRREGFDALLGDPALDGAQIAALQQTILDTRALERTEDLIADYSRRADLALADAEVDTAALEDLRALARAATERTA